MPVPSELVELVERFRRNLDIYKRADYKETRVRVEFVDPLFEALGWDVRNLQGYAEQYKDVIHEDAIKVSGATRAPDYCFRVGGTRKFFLEVKKPSVAIHEDVGPAYQLRRYAWSAKLPLSVLTDFEEFAVYDCRQKPNPKDKVGVGRVMYLTFEQYLDLWDDIHSIFAKRSVLKGSFDRYVQETTGKRGTSEVDSEFLKEIEGWRDTLARNIALRNTALSVYELNFAVQRTIDRIVFLRMCEDRGIEPYGRLLALVNGPRIYPRLGELYRQADEKYNAGLFDFRDDTLTPVLTIDDRVLKSILDGLYYPQCPYEFSVLPADVLGQVYEQFLGKVIRLTPAHRAVVEEKPEVKKAGGVYYTPTYIVDYIVKQTVGKLVKGKTPLQMARLRILDPACGSGSFLLGAFQYLLDTHLHWYEANDPEKHARGKQPAVFEGPNGGWRLTSSEKKRILLNNLYGVDIDRQAVEVTKLSLLLKVLEGETDETLGQQLALWHKPALPDLGNNIKCGNSLIGPDYFQAQLMPDEQEMRRVNPFDWQAEFPEVITSGGFDALIGNPPYIRIQTMKEWVPTEVEFFKRVYTAASKGNYDIYVVFVERALQLLNKHGLMGYILPHKFFQAKYGEPLRELISDGKHLTEVVHFGDQQVFAGATTYTCLLFLDKAGNDCFHYIDAHDLDTWRASGKAVEGEIRADKATAGEWNFIVGPGAALNERLSRMPAKLGDVAHVFVGTQTSADTIFVLEECYQDGDNVVGVCKATGEQVRMEAGLVKPFLRGKDIRRYEPLKATASLICPYSIEESDFGLLTEAELSRKYPRAYAYLKSHKAALAAREKGKFKGANWFAFGYPKSMTLFQLPKLVVPDYNNVASFTFDDQGHFYKTGYGIILNHEVKESVLYTLGLLNTKLLFQYLLQIGTTLRGGYVRFWTQFIEQLPVRTINFDDPADIARHDKIVALVERMLELHKKLATISIPADKSLYQRQIAATDKQINALVYELYCLTEEEIRIVEESR